MNDTYLWSREEFFFYDLAENTSDAEPFEVCFSKKVYDDEVDTQIGIGYKGSHLYLFEEELETYIKCLQSVKKEIFLKEGGLKLVEAEDER